MNEGLTLTTPFQLLNSNILLKHSTSRIMIFTDDLNTAEPVCFETDRLINGGETPFSAEEKFVSPMQIQFECHAARAFFFMLQLQLRSSVTAIPQIPIRNQKLARISPITIERGSRSDQPVKKTLTIGSEEWNQLTQRRAILIRKKNREGLSPEEFLEFESLQKQSRDAIQKAFPAPDLIKPYFEAIEKSTDNSKDSTSQ